MRDRSLAGADLSHCILLKRDNERDEWRRNGVAIYNRFEHKRYGTYNQDQWNSELKDLTIA
jgi:hypothetical protein